MIYIKKSVSTLGGKAKGWRSTRHPGRAEGGEDFMRQHEAEVLNSGQEIRW